MRKVFTTESKSWDYISFHEGLGHKVEVNYTPKGRIIVTVAK